MRSIEKCRKILNKNKHKYTDEEIRGIREFLYQMANLEINMRKELNDKFMKR